MNTWNQWCNSLPSDPVLTVAAYCIGTGWHFCGVPGLIPVYCCHRIYNNVSLRLGLPPTEK